MVDKVRRWALPALAVPAVGLIALLCMRLMTHHLTAQEMLSSTVKVELRHVVSMHVKVPALGVEQDVDDEDVGGSGSGFVAAVDDVSSLVVTASHVCDDWREKTMTVPSIFGDVEVTMVTKELSLSLVNFEGRRFERIAVVEDDQRHDLCVVEVPSATVGPVARVSGRDPGAGDELVHTGAPSGMWGPHAGAVVRGTSMGVMAVEGLPGRFVGMMLSTVGGSSGGPVWDGDEVVAVLVRGTVPDGDITLAVQGAYVRGLLTQAEATWRAMSTR